MHVGLCKQQANCCVQPQIHFCLHYILFLALRGGGGGGGGVALQLSPIVRSVLLKIKTFTQDWSSLFFVCLFRYLKLSRLFQESPTVRSSSGSEDNRRVLVS